MQVSLCAIVTYIFCCSCSIWIAAVVYECVFTLWLYWGKKKITVLQMNNWDLPKVTQTLLPMLAVKFSNSEALFIGLIMRSSFLTFHSWPAWLQHTLLKDISVQKERTKGGIMMRSWLGMQKLWIYSPLWIQNSFLSKRKSPGLALYQSI